MSILGVIPCSKEKIWDICPDVGPTLAKKAYRSAFHHLAREYILPRVARWVIFSAKYGFLEPDDTIPSAYDVTFSRAEDPCIALPDLIVQSRKFLPLRQIICVCPSMYGNKVDAVFLGRCPVLHPLKGVGGWGEMHRWLRENK